MKLNQTPNEIIIQQSGIGQVLFGATFIVVGVILAYLSITQEGAPIWVLLIGTAFAVAGATAAVTARHTTTTITKNDQLAISQKRVLLGSTDQQSIPTSRIASVRLATEATQSSSSDNSGSGRTSHLVLLLDDNALVEIARKSQNSTSINGINLGMIRKAPLAEEAKVIAEFLGVELDVSDTSTLTGAIKSIKSALAEQGHDLKKK